ncbi:DNA methyltransferase [Marinobacter sp. C18]|uniref:site-specific DNA-methyltransferase n=1 Tax=Marinobacter sp. C18 TaxID=1772288 RepID=UPI000948AE55|nr:site-specific DNA-methyltransferase [Marinobacter sp. C18]OLF81952.1 DNA methyltransferase [Marinobacter sp. C18]
MQLSLFSSVKSVYANTDGPLDNESLYRRVAREAGISLHQVNEKSPIGESGQMHSKFQREVRWHQQTLKAAGLLKRTEQRGRWELTKEGKTSLRKVQPRASMVAFSTRLGTALWSLSADVFEAIDAPITLCLTSPPYPLAKPRAYGNPTLDDYIRFVVDSMRPIVANLVDGGSICLNISNDIFCPGTPARSIYREKLVIALAEELGLWKMDVLAWANPCKAPGPVQWASKTRQQLNVGYEPIYWFSNNPQRAIADNRRVLQPHSEKHLAYVRRGGNQVERSYSDGAYRTLAGAYSQETAGKIPRNVLTYPHNCPAQKRYKAAARNMGLAAHGAPYPLALALFLIRFLSREGDLVVDPFGGSLTTAEGAEITGRKWLTTDCIFDYVMGGSTRFSHLPSFEMNPDFAAMAAA